MPFKPGVSGNPNGRPAIAREIRELARADLPEFYQRLRAIALNDEHKGQLHALIAGMRLGGASFTDSPATDHDVAEPSLRDMTHEELVQLVSETDPARRLILKREFESRIAKREANGAKH